MALSPILGLILTLASTWLLHLIYKFYIARTRFRGLPQPPHSPLFGHLKVMGEASASMPPNTHPQAYLTSIALKYSLRGIFYLDLYPVADPMVILNVPEVMEQVTVTSDMPKHSISDDFMAPGIGRNNIASANGPAWKKAHSAMRPAFSWSHIRSLTDVMVDECEQFRETLAQLSVSGEAFSMEETSAKLIFDIIARILFNQPLYAQTQGSQTLDDIRAMFKLTEAQFSWNPLVKIDSFVRRNYILRRLHASLSAKITERYGLLRRESIVPNKKDPYSILDLMLREQLTVDADKGKDKLDPLYLQELLVNVKALLVGGHGTTTDTLCYIYMLLSKAPDVLSKLRDEHTHIFSADLDETIEILRDSPSKLNDLNYTTAVIQETLRLFPVGFSPREGAPGSTVTYNNQKYPVDNNLVVVPNAHSVQYDPEYFPSPASFQPTRFADPDKPVPRSHFWSFSRGPRGCLGLNLAQDELRIILLITVREFEFSCVGLRPNKTARTEFTDMDTVFGDIVFQELGNEAKPRGGMMMRVKKA